MKLSRSSRIGRSALASQVIVWGVVPLLVVLCVPLVGHAQTKETLPGAALSPANASMPLGGPLFIVPFKYLPPSGTNGSPEADVPQPKRKPEQQRIIDLHAEGNYLAVGTEGLALMAKEKQEEDLQLIVANSLAWTGRTKEAVIAYQGLVNGKYANEANVGLANLQRWGGRDDLAAQIYRTVLSVTSTNADALDGLELATRELSPRTTFSVGGSSDSFEVQSRSNTVNHRWRDKSGSTIMEIETSGVKNWLPDTEARQQDLTLRYENLALDLKPSVELSMPTASNRTLYGSVRIKLAEDAVSLSAGRLNWGRMAANPNALTLGLAASHLGATATYGFTLGTLRGRVDYYDITDNNRIISTSVHLASNWRPLGNNFRPFVGVQTRTAKFTSPNYWSPEMGSGTLYAGLLGEWGSADWNFYTSVQSGARLYGDAGRSWAISGGGKRWLSDDLALSMTFWAMESVRDSAAYKAQSASFSLEKLWR